MTSQQVVNQRIRLKSDQSTWSSSTLGNNGCRKNKGKMEDGKHRSDILKYMSQCLCVYNNDSLGQSRPKVQQCCTQYLFDSYLSISFTSSCHNLYLYLFHCFIVWLYHCCMIVWLYDCMIVCKTKQAGGRTHVWQLSISFTKPPLSSSTLSCNPVCCCDIIFRISWSVSGKPTKKK